MNRDMNAWHAALALAEHMPSHVSHQSAFNICVSGLSSGYQRAVCVAIERGALDHKIIDGMLWVSGADLFELAGPCADPDDPFGDCHIPSSARNGRTAK